MGDQQDQPTSSESNTVRFQLAMSSTTRKISSLISEKLEDGLTGPQCYILKLISEEKRVTASMLAERMEVKPSAITVMIDRLVQHGFVKRLADEQDRRVTLLLPTEKGSIAMEKVILESRKIHNRLLNTLDPAEIEHFVNTFERIALAASTLEG
ncbi:MarR family transcriptional regulator [Paenibacillus baekrokdamisoli]|uniref:MarR family transcriptional regulator n=1 Tax=Paenibacillus baekrokdamisoli TaxID=1712516 RepID=A0A3G9ILL9_9BACL|nr:MarR family transcriptional regulator [Paenibacillus baekrokdamisoli]MBB3067713.1 DNA-binding MarR family transcriptional regulator [Paenibacillus baekrokdamisoli]BBH19102.1 MarR family transcriptional regulator [Paenibacillus baekrokdamisoli]